MPVFFLSASAQDAEPASNSEPDPYYFNSKKVPESMEDLVAIEKALKEGREKVKDAVVAIEVGGGSGSGVIISEDGLVLTAAHVTAGVGKELDIVLPDGTKVKGVSLGLRSDFDAAMAQITEGGPYPFVEVEKEAPPIGEWVFSLGHSGGFDGDRGMVTRIGRIVRKQDHTIQSDCTLIGGDSGGPLFNMKGELVGIHSRVSRSLEQNMHVTIPMFTEKWDEMKNSEFLGEGPFAQKTPGFLGVEVEEVDGGLKVLRVGKDTGAEEAGLKVGDLMLSMNGVALETRDILAETIASQMAGSKVKIKIKRGEEELEIEATLAEKFAAE